MDLKIKKILLILALLVMVTSVYSLKVISPYPVVNAGGSGGNTYNDSWINDTFVKYSGSDNNVNLGVHNLTLNYLNITGGVLSDLLVLGNNYPLLTIGENLTYSGQVYWDHLSKVFAIDSYMGAFNISIASVGGNVGIGTSTPTQKLSVNGNVTAKTYMSIYQNVFSGLVNQTYTSTNPNNIKSDTNITNFYNFSYWRNYRHSIPKYLLSESYGNTKYTLPQSTYHIPFDLDTGDTLNSHKDKSTSISKAMLIDTFYNPNVTTGTNCPVGNCIRLNGTNRGFMNDTTWSVFNKTLGSDVSYALWLKQTTPYANYQPLIGFYSKGIYIYNTGSSDIQLIVGKVGENGSVCLDYVSGGGCTITNKSDWNSIVISYDNASTNGNNLKGWVNGVECLNYSSTCDKKNANTSLNKVDNYMSLGNYLGSVNGDISFDEYLFWNGTALNSTHALIYDSMGRYPTNMSVNNGSTTINLGYNTTQDISSLTGTSLIYNYTGNSSHFINATISYEINVTTTTNETGIGLTGNYSVGECWFKFTGGIMTNTNCTGV